MHYRDAWTVHFIEADCRTTIGSTARFYSFADLKALRSFVTRCTPEDATLDGFDHNVRAWGRGKRVRPPDAGAVQEAPGCRKGLGWSDVAFLVAQSVGS